VWVAMTVSAAIYQGSIPPLTEEDRANGVVHVGTNTVAATVSLVFIFVFGAVYSIGFTPLQALYPVEVLSFEMRAKGMGFSGFAVAAGMSPLTFPPQRCTNHNSFTTQPVRLASRHG
jgi:hypothetical protein